PAGLQVPADAWRVEPTTGSPATVGVAPLIGVTGGVTTAGVRSSTESDGTRTQAVRRNRMPGGSTYSSQSEDAQCGAPSGRVTERRITGPRSWITSVGMSSV